jgi:hypothetical protein
MSKAPAPTWVSSSAICQEFGINRQTLESLRVQGILKAKHHYKNISASPFRATYRYHRQRFERALDKLTESTVDEGSSYVTALTVDDGELHKNGG